jgi:alpha-amylase
LTSIVFYFQVHQPYRLERFTTFDVGRGRRFWDDELNRAVMERVAERCYLPMNRVLEQAIEDTDGGFRCAFSISGTALDQMEAWAPEALASFQRLASTGAVEFLAETSMHSLSALGGPEEFSAQVRSHAVRIEELFGRRPTSFRNTELITDETIARCVERLGFDVLLAEGADTLLDGRCPQSVWRPRGCNRLKLLLRSYSLSDDIAYRFSNREWPAYPLMAETFAAWLDELPLDADFVGLFMDYETFGEHQWVDTGILDFMAALPERVLDNPRLDFATPGELAAVRDPVGSLPFPRAYSWADEHRDLSAWLGNPMQRAAHKALYGLGPAIRASRKPDLLEDWRRLTTSDHVYYMATKQHSDAEVHEYFSPYESPHDAFILFMNVLDDLRARLAAASPTSDNPAPLQEKQR